MKIETEPHEGSAVGMLCAQFHLDELPVFLWITARLAAIHEQIKIVASAP